MAFFGYIDQIIQQVMTDKNEAIIKIPNYRKKSKPAFNKRYTLRSPVRAARVPENTSRAVRPLWCFLPPHFSGCWNYFVIPLSQP